MRSDFPVVVITSGFQNIKPLLFHDWPVHTGYRLAGMQVCRCRIFPALKSQAGKPRANEHPTFHQHFRQLAGMSPLRYQKWLRLNEARRLMLNEHYDVTTAAYAVGYESLSHFSREYSRMFGESPKRDITGLRKSVGQL